MGFAAWARGGWIGVDLFFVLSGFLVSGLLFSEYRREGRLRVGRFLVRRAFKIYPAFWAFLAATVIAAAAVGTPLAWSGLAGELAFVQNYGPHLWNHTWSLAVEEHFYLLCPAVLVLLARGAPGATDPFRGVPAGFVVLAVVLLAGRIIAAQAVPFSPWVHVVPTHFRIDSLGFGATLAYLTHFRRESIERFVARFRPTLALGGVLLLLPPAFLELERTPAIFTAGFTALYLGSGALVLACVVGRERVEPSLSVRLLAAIGAHSYSIYLWHMPVRYFLIPKLAAVLETDRDGLPMLALYLAISVGVGMGMARAIEFPMLRLRDRLRPSGEAVAPG